MAEYSSFPSYGSLSSVQSLLLVDIKLPRQTGACLKTGPPRVLGFPFLAHKAASSHPLYSHLSDGSGMIQFSEGNPVGVGTTRRGTATPVHRPQRPAGSTHSSTTGLKPPEQLERPAGLPSSYDGDLRLPLGLSLGSPIFPSGCEGKLGVALESLQGKVNVGSVGWQTRTVVGVPGGWWEAKTLF